MKNISLLAAFLLILSITPFMMAGLPAILPIPQGNIPDEPALYEGTPTSTAFSFVSMSDAHIEPVNFAATVNQAASLNPDLIIFNGDLENEGVINTQMDPMIADLKNAGVFNQTFLVRGNHDDYVSGSASLWENYFETVPNIKTLPAGVTDYVSLDSNSDYLNYSFIYGNAMFIGLDVPGDADLLTSAELNFLDARLIYAESQGLTHAFIFFHGPLYCVESVHCNCSTKSDASCTPSALVSVINNHPIVSATFHGHEHVLGWVHMDNTRVAGLTGSFEEFITSPSGGWTYNAYLYPNRMDYTYLDMGSSQGFAAISVDGASFTYSIYKVGTTLPVWSKAFYKAGVITPTPSVTPTATSTPTSTPTPVTAFAPVSTASPIALLASHAVLSAMSPASPDLATRPNDTSASLSVGAIAFQPEFARVVISASLVLIFRDTS